MLPKILVVVHHQNPLLLFCLRCFPQQIKMTTGLHDRLKCHRCICFFVFFFLYQIHSRSYYGQAGNNPPPLPPLYIKTSSAIHGRKKKIVLHINSQQPFLSFAKCMTCQKGWLYNTAGVRKTHCICGGVMSAPGTGSVLIYFKMTSGVISCQIHGLWRYENKRSCNHHPLVSLAEEGAWLFSH